VSDESAGGYKFQLPPRVFRLRPRDTRRGGGGGGEGGGRTSGRAIVINSVSRALLISIWPANRDVARAADTTGVPGKRSIYIGRITQYRRRPIPQGRDSRPFPRVFPLFFSLPVSPTVRASRERGVERSADLNSAH